MAAKPGGGGLRAIVAGPLRKELFLRLPLQIADIHTEKQKEIQTN